MATILVTGGAGFIGSHVVDAYIQAGHTVYVVDNLSSGLRENVHPSAHFIDADITALDWDALLSEVRPEVINHHAAQIDVRYSVERPTEDARVNVLGTLALLEAARKHAVTKVIFASSGGAVYGEPTTLPASEHMPPQPLSPYGMAKYIGEQYILFYARLYGLRYAVLRYANVYGPRQRPDGEAGVCSIFAAALLEGRTPVLYGDGRPVRDYVYVGDVARANVAALTASENVLVNIGSGVGTTVYDVFRMLSQLLDVRVEPQLAPLRTGEVFRIFLDCRHAGQKLGWKAEVSLSDGLQKLLDWMRNGEKRRS
jgi:UDP-glucose 4-epimerase